MKRWSFFVVGMLMCMSTFAQQALWGSAPVLSPEVHENHTVTFRLRAPKAVKVQIVGDFTPQGMVDMVENGQGVWEYTTPEPLAPELYCYNYVVDGLTGRYGNIRGCACNTCHSDYPQFQRFA